MPLNMLFDKFIFWSNNPRKESHKSLSAKPAEDLTTKQKMTKPKNYISQQGFDSLSAEYEQLYKQERPQVCKTVAWAAGNGDRSENADYIYGKKRLREIDRRLRFLGKRLKAAEVVNFLHHEDDIIRFGATVELEGEDEEKTVDHKTIIIVFPPCFCFAVVN